MAAAADRRRRCRLAGAERARRSTITRAPTPRRSTPPARIFPMLPEALSTDRTSLNQSEDRPALVVDMAVADDGDVRRRGGLSRGGAEPRPAHLRRRRPPGSTATVRPRPAIGQVDGARARSCGPRIAWPRSCATRREAEGALDFDRTEIKPVMGDGVSRTCRSTRTNRARDMIESFMIAANGVTARFLTAHGLASIRRVVRAPEALAAHRRDRRARTAPRCRPSPTPRALEAVPARAARGGARDAFRDLSLSILKLLGPRRVRRREPGGGAGSAHFGLAVSDYTHSTAPNRRFPDLVTQRLVKAAAGGSRAPYTLAELDAARRALHEAGGCRQQGGAPGPQVRGRAAGSATASARSSTPW